MVFQVNFTEAALFLQGTAAVYSKKVEFLWQNVLKMLDLLASKKALEEASEDNDQGEDGTTKKRTKKSAYDLSGFSLISIELCRNTDLKKDHSSGKTDSVHSRKMTLKFIFVTPRQLIEKEGKEQKTTRINMYTIGKYDLLGQKEDFRVNSQFAMATAMIGEELGAESELGQQSVSLCDSDLSGLALHQSFMPPAASASLNKSNSIVIQPHEIQENNDDNEIFAPEPLEDDNLDFNADNDEDSGNNNSKSKQKEAAADEEVPKAPLADPWEPIKPHEVVTIPKPIRKGRRKREIAAAADASKVKQKKTRSRGGGGENDSNNTNHDESNVNKSKTRVSVPVEEFIIQEVANVNVSNFDNMPSEFADEAAEAAKKRKAAEKAKNKEANKMDEDGWTDFVQDDLAADAFDVDEDNEFLPEPPDPVAGGTGEEEDSEKNKDSYEELVMKRVASYVAQSQDYIESTDLARRVRVWHDNLAPRLEAVEKRGDFDVHNYGSRIISQFPKDNRKTSLDFKTVAGGKEKEEIARLFLSTLMLANTENIDLQCSAPKSEFLPMDQVSLTLLSTQRHHEHLMKNIPSSSSSSQSQSQSRPTSQSQAKRKKAVPRPMLTPVKEVDNSADDSNHFDDEYEEGMEALDALPDIAKAIVSSAKSTKVAKKVTQKPINGLFAVPGNPVKSKSRSRGGRLPKQKPVNQPVASTSSAAS